MPELMLPTRAVRKPKRSKIVPGGRADCFAGLYAPAVVDIFAGVGGWSIGAERAFVAAGLRDRYIDLMINHWDVAVGVHQVNHPLTQHLRANILEVDPAVVLPGRRIAYLHASPDCFPAGTLVLSSDGYVPIEQIQIGDQVLTHQGRWRSVTATMKTVKKVRMIRGHGHHGLRVSSEHPFLTARRDKVWNNTRRSYEYIPTSDEWVSAKDLTDKHFWATPTLFEPLAVPAVGGHSLDETLPTVTASKDFAVVDATLATLQTLNHGGNEHRAQSPADPMHTVTGARDARALVAALVTKHYGGHETPGSSPDAPLDSVTAKDHNALTCAYLSHLYGTNKGSRGDAAEPAPTITGSSNHAALVTAFLSTYYGNSKDGHQIHEPAPTVVGKDRIQLVTVVIDGQTFVITDIAMRMLRPRELARAQGFPDEYVIDRQADGTPVSRADQVKLIGNSVCPQVAEAIVRENVVKLGVLDDSPVAVGGAA